MAPGTFFPILVPTQEKKRREQFNQMWENYTPGEDGCTIVLTDDQEAGKRGVWFCSVTGEELQLCPSVTLGHRRECYREPLVYVSVNVKSFQDHDSRQTAKIKGRGREGGRGGELVHCSEGAGRSKDLQLCYSSVSWRIRNNRVYDTNKAGQETQAYILVTALTFKPCVESGLLMLFQTENVGNCWCVTLLKVMAKKPDRKSVV